MASTGRQEESGLIASASQALAMLGSGDTAYSPEEQAKIFKLVARGAKTPEEKVLFLKTLEAEGLSPWKKELFATRRVMKRGKPDQYEVMVLITSFHVFVSRTRRAGFLLGGAEVYDNDEFIWDAANYRPAKHLVSATDRGLIVGAWAEAVHIKTGLRTGKYYPIGELPDVRFNPVLSKMPGHAATKTAICMIARLVTPDLSSLYAAEEFGVAVYTGGQLQHLPEGLPEDPMSQLEAQRDVAPEGVNQDQADDGGPVVDVNADAGPAQLINPSEVVQILRGLSTVKVIKSGDIINRLSEIVGRKVESPKEITSAEFGGVMSALKEGKTQ